MDEGELITKANWLREAMIRDSDVRAGLMSALMSRGYPSMVEFVDTDPDGFLAVIDALREMTEQIPIEETWSVGEGKPS